MLSRDLVFPLPSGWKFVGTEDWSIDFLGHGQNVLPDEGELVTCLVHPGNTNVFYAGRWLDIHRQRVGRPSISAIGRVENCWHDAKAEVGT